MSERKNGKFPSDNSPGIDPVFAQSLVDSIAAQLNKNVIICDKRGVIIAAYHRERIQQLHEASEIMLKSGEIYEFSVTAEDVRRLSGVRKGFNVPIVFEERCVGVIGVTGDPDEAAPYARLASQFVQAALESNTRQEKLVRALKEKEQLQATLLNKMIEVQEDERRRISRELHDETSQALTFIIVGLRVLSEQIKTEQEHKKVLELRDVTLSTLEAVHRLAVELRPLLLDERGLVAAATRFIDDYSKQYGLIVKADFSKIKRERFQLETETTLYRIIQESLTNIAKHAKASKVEISLKKEQGRLFLTITDDGIGFSQKTLRGAATRKSLGIYGMKERAELLFGSFSIRSVVGQGTTVTVELPVQEKK